jgi:hypothetical protein
MRKLLFTWELGGGLGHLLILRPLMKELVVRGHKVVLAARKLE